MGISRWTESTAEFPASPTPTGRHRRWIGPQPALRRPRLLLQRAQYDVVFRELSEPPRHSGPHKLLIQVPSVRQDDLGHRALVSIDVAHADALLHCGDTLPKLGGKKAAESLNAAQRVARAKKAAATRWEKKPGATGAK